MLTLVSLFTRGGLSPRIPSSSLPPKSGPVKSKTNPVNFQGDWIRGTCATSSFPFLWGKT